MKLILLLYDERPIIIVTLNDECSLEKIMNHLRKKYASFQLPDDILVWKEIPGNFCVCFNPQIIFMFFNCFFCMFLCVFFNCYNICFVINFLDTHLV